MFYYRSVRPRRSFSNIDQLRRRFSEANLASSAALSFTGPRRFKTFCLCFFCGGRPELALNDSFSFPSEFRVRRIGIIRLTKARADEESEKDAFNIQQPVFNPARLISIGGQ